MVVLQIDFFNLYIFMLLQLKTKFVGKDHFHLIGIGGIGMSAIAIALIKNGYSVSGSDLVQNIETHKLKELGAKIFDSQKKIILIL